MMPIGPQYCHAWYLVFKSRHEKEKRVGSARDAIVSRICMGMCRAATISADMGANSALFATENWQDMTIPYPRSPSIDQRLRR
jgi:hypothetical protein